MSLRTSRPSVYIYRFKGNAKLQGLVKQLNLVGNEYNIALVCISSIARAIPLICDCRLCTLL